MKDINNLFQDTKFFGEGIKTSLSFKEADIIKSVKAICEDSELKGLFKKLSEE